MKIVLFIFSLFLLSGCLGMPNAVKPITGFELNNYLGKWYEVARLDHSFERGMSQVIAEYTLKKDGGVLVTNRGYLATEKEWKTAEGKAYFVNDETEGYLKVSFFGPFYGSYVIFELERKSYQYAFVSGPNEDYLWLLSRTPDLSPEIIEKFVVMSKDRGFNTDELIFVQHK